MESDRYIKAILYVTVIVWVAVLYASGVPVTSVWLKPFSTVTTIVLFLVVAFDLWLWKLPLLHGWFVKRPVIEGTWKAALRSNWSDSESDRSTQAIEGYAIIHQTFSKLSIRLLTEESSSELVGAEIVCSVDGMYCVSGVYRNEPRYGARGRSPIHYGAVWLKVIDEPIHKLQGHYWTDRRTAGEMELTDQRKKRLQDFRSAQAYYADNG
jgi:hypothetical protein